MKVWTSREIQDGFIFIFFNCNSDCNGACQTAEGGVSLILETKGKRAKQCEVFSFWVTWDS